jgi:hypothetical protein
VSRDAWYVVGAVLISAGASLLINLLWPPVDRPRPDRRG